MLYILLAMVLYTIAIMIGTIAARNTDSNLVSAIVNIVSAIIPTAVVFPILNKKLFENGKTGILLAILGGVTIALFTMALNKSFSINKVAIVSPIVFGGSIFLTSILSYFFLKEKITVVQAIGLFFLGIGVLLIIYAKTTGK